MVPDFRQFRFWLEKAFENGELAAGQILAQVYRARRNYKKAMEWNIKVIESEDMPICAIASAEYNMGGNVPKSLQRSVALQSGSIYSQPR